MSQVMDFINELETPNFNGDASFSKSDSKQIQTISDWETSAETDASREESFDTDPEEVEIAPFTPAITPFTPARFSRTTPFTPYTPARSTGISSVNRFSPYTPARTTPFTAAGTPATSPMSPAPATPLNDGTVLMTPDQEDAVIDELFVPISKVSAQNVTKRTSSGENKEGPNAFEAALNRLKKQRRRKNVDPNNAQDRMHLLISKMNEAYQLDLKAMKEDQPAVNKLSILSHVKSELNKKQWQDWFVSCGGCKALAQWIQPFEDGSLPNLTLREAVLDIISKLSVSSNNLKSSGLAKTVKALFNNEKENTQNRQLCQQLCNKWIRDVFGQTTSESRKRRMAEESIDEDRLTSVIKKPKTQEQVAKEEALVQARRHPEMFAKPVFNFKVNKRSTKVEACAKRDPKALSSRLNKTLGNLSGSLRRVTNSKALAISIAGKEINLAFKN